MKTNATKETFLQLIGWIFFVAGTCLFIISSARSGDNVALVGSIAFLLGCLVFMAPLVAPFVVPLVAPFVATARPQRWLGGPSWRRSKKAL